MIILWEYLPDGETIVITYKNGRKRSFPKGYVLREEKGCIWMLSGALEGGRLNLGNAPGGPYVITLQETWEIRIKTSIKRPVKAKRKQHEHQQHSLF